jgi:hypothetical protein
VSEAEVTEQLRAPVMLSSLSVDGNAGKLAFGYSIGGGCAEHVPEAAVTLTESSEHVYTANVTVSDVSSGPDHCEAMLYREGTADLSSLIASAAERTKADVSGRTMSVHVPALLLVVGSSAGAAAATPRGAPLDMSTMSFDRGSGRLDFEYRVSGGCAEHHPVTTIELSKHDEYMFVAKVAIFDVPSQDDFCEALLQIKGSAVLPTLVADAAKAAGEDLEGRSIAVELPAVSTVAR